MKFKLEHIVAPYLHQLIVMVLIFLIGYTTYTLFTHASPECIINEAEISSEVANICNLNELLSKLIMIFLLVSIAVEIYMIYTILF